MSDKPVPLAPPNKLLPNYRPDDAGAGRWFWRLPDGLEARPQAINFLLSECSELTIENCRFDWNPMLPSR